MAASQFGVLTPLQHYNQQQPSQPTQSQPQQQQQQQQQQHYNQLSFQPVPQAQPPLPPPLPPPPPPSSHQQQQQQHHVTTATAQPTTNNHTSNGNIHPQLQSQPPSPAVNGTASATSAGTGSPLQPRQIQSITTASDPATDLASTQDAGSANPPAIDTATASSPTDNTAPPNPKRRRRTKRRRLEEEAELALSAPAPPRPPTVHPFSKGPYDTLEDAIFSLQLHVFTSGYGVSQKRTVKEKLPSGKYDPDGDVIRKDFACDKGGNEFVSQSRGERRRESKKCGCPWKAAIRRLRREGDRWFIEILEAQHNHPVTSPDEMHTLASYRRWQRENNAGIRSAIARLTRAAAMPTRDIVAYLKGDVRDHDLDRIDKQILRALSMNDKDVPSNEREGGSVVFEMIARRPVIILQDNDRAPSSTATMNGGYSGAPNPPPPSNFIPNPPAPTAPFNESPAAYHHTFANSFTNPPPTTMGGTNGGTTAMHSEYPVIPQQ